MGHHVAPTDAENLDGKSPLLANSYALVRPMPRMAAAVSTFVVMPRVSTASAVHAIPVGVALASIDYLRCRTATAGARPGWSKPTNAATSRTRLPRVEHSAGRGQLS